MYGGERGGHREIGLDTYQEGKGGHRLCGWSFNWVETKAFAGGVI